MKDLRESPKDLPSKEEEEEQVIVRFNNILF